MKHLRAATMRRCSLYLFGFVVSLAPPEGGVEAKRSLLEVVLPWTSSAEDSQGALGEYTEPEYVPESSDAPTDPPGDGRADPPGDGRADPPGDRRADTPGDRRADTPGDGRADPPGDQRADPPGDRWADAPGQVDVTLEEQEFNRSATDSSHTPTPKTRPERRESSEDGAAAAGQSTSTTQTRETTPGPGPGPGLRLSQSPEANWDSAGTRGKSRDIQNATVAPCRASNDSWMSNDTEDPGPPWDPLRLSLPLSLSLFVPLYSDWNSALASWGPVWEVHIYVLGSALSALGVTSLVCLLALPLRCPPGVLYFALLHVCLLSFCGIQAFALVYDPYSFQDRLPPLSLAAVCAVPFPCLTLAFSATFILLSLRSNLQISLPLAISPSFSALPKPFLLVSMSVCHFGLSLGCVGGLEFFPILPSIILLIPQGIFVCLAIFQFCSFFVFFCLVLVDSKHMYRLNDSGESTGSPEAVRPPRSPFAQMKDWKRALRSGLAASIFLLGCGGLQLYALLHALGFGGYEDRGFQPWPWWGFQVGCRLCEIAVCLSLALIGTRPVFCQNSSSMKSMIKPKSGSWSRLSPSRELAPASEGVVLSSHESWDQSKPEDDESPPVKATALPLGPMEATGNRTAQKPDHKPSPSSRLKNGIEVSPSLIGLDSTVDLRPPSPIDLSRSIDQALFSESLFSHSIFEWPRLYKTSSSLSLNHDGKSSLLEDGLYRATSCTDVEQEKPPGSERPLGRSGRTGAADGSTQELCSRAKEVRKARSHSWANRGHALAQGSLPRAMAHLPHYRRFRTLSAASRDDGGSRKLCGTKTLSESKQLEWDIAVQAEFVDVCRQIDALSVCSDTIDL